MRDLRYNLNEERKEKEKKEQKERMTQFQQNLDIDAKEVNKD